MVIIWVYVKDNFPGFKFYILNNTLFTIYGSKMYDNSRNNIKKKLNYVAVSSLHYVWRVVIFESKLVN